MHGYKLRFQSVGIAGKLNHEEHEAHEDKIILQLRPSCSSW